MSKEKSEYLINRNDNQYEVVIGLEVHAQVLSQSKLFSTSATKFGAEPNTQVSLVDAAFPGMLPVINEFCVKQAIKTGIGLKAKINKRSVFDRKNYFYADLPQGYQISQFKDPIVGEGKVILDMPDGQKEVGIERLHLEQDAGKSIHDLDPKNTFVDLNRSGVALMEIVSKPDLRSPEEVNAYIKKLRSIMRYLGTCDGNMQEGSLRADVNVSVRKKGTKDFGTRCEIKNVNSIKSTCLFASYSIAICMNLIELTFLISHLVPKSFVPFFLTETLTSALKDPSCILPSQVPKYRMIDLNFLIYALTSSGDLKSGLLTISIKATPDLFKSTKVFFGSKSWILLPASCSKCNLSIPTSF